MEPNVGNNFYYNVDAELDFFNTLQDTDIAALSKCLDTITGTKKKRKSKHR